MSIRLRLSFCHRIPYIRHRAHPWLPQNENGQPEKLKRENCIKVGILLFAGYVDGVTSIAESCGGGGDPGKGWGRDKDEDEEARARRAANKASWLCKPMRRTIKR